MKGSLIPKGNFTKKALGIVMFRVGSLVVDHCRVLLKGPPFVLVQLFLREGRWDLHYDVHLSKKKKLFNTQDLFVRCFDCTEVSIIPSILQVRIQLPDLDLLTRICTKSLSTACRLFKSASRKLTRNVETKGQSMTGSHHRWIRFIALGGCHHIFLLPRTLTSCYA